MKLSLESIDWKLMSQMDKLWVSKFKIQPNYFMCKLHLLVSIMELVIVVETLGITNLVRAQDFPKN